jgi:hypothetical protein
MFCTAGNGWIANHCGMFRGRSPREELFADETPAHVLTDDEKYFADPVGAGGASVSLRFFVSRHVRSR